MPANSIPTRRVMTKRVNIDAPTAIRALNPPLLGKANNVIMSTGDILKCLCKRAKVDEVLPDGTTVRLNMANYYLDNSSQATRIPAPPAPNQHTIQSEMVVTEPDPAEEEAPVEEETVEADEPEAEESSAEEAEAAEEEGESEPAEETEPTEEVAPPQIPVPQPPRQQNKRGPKKHK